MSSFVWTERGLVPKVAEQTAMSPHTPDADVDALIVLGVDQSVPQAADRLAPKPEPVQHVQPPLKAFAPGVSTSAISPKHVVRAAKQRVKEIRQELKSHRALQRELAQLENLLQAARKPTHIAEVRQLSSTRK